MKKVFKRIVTTLIVFTVLGGTGFGIYTLLQKQQEAAAQALESMGVVAATAVEVSVEPVKSGSLHVSTEFIGRIQPDESVNVFPKIAGTVSNTYFEIGQAVKKGDLLFEIDPSDIQLSVNVAQASYNVAKVGVERSLGSALESQVLQSDTALKNAQNAFSNANKSFKDFVTNNEPDLDKLDDTIGDLQDSKKQAETYRNVTQNLLAQADKAYQDYLKSTSNDITLGLSSRDPAVEQRLYLAWQEARSNAAKAGSAYESISSSYESMKQAYNQKEDGYDVQFDQLKTAMKSANLALESAQNSKALVEDKALPEAEAGAEASLAQAKASLDTATKQLEYTKIRSPIDGVIELKNVSQHGIASQQNPAYTVSNKQIMVVRFAVPASAVEAMVVGDTLSIENGSKTYSGSVVEIGGMVDPQSGLFPVKARIDGTAMGELLNGLSVKVVAETQKADDTLLIPVDSVYHDDGQAYVYLLTPDSVAKKTLITTGITDDTLVQVVSGLSSSDKVITSWASSLADGIAVALPGQTAPPVPQSSSGAASMGALSSDSEVSSRSEAGEE